MPEENVYKGILLPLWASFYGKPHCRVGIQIFVVGCAKFPLLHLSFQSNHLCLHFVPIGSILVDFIAFEPKLAKRLFLEQFAPLFLFLKQVLKGIGVPSNLAFSCIHRCFVLTIVFEIVILTCTINPN